MQTHTHNTHAIREKPVPIMLFYLLYMLCHVQCSVLINFTLLPSSYTCLKIFLTSVRVYYI